MEDSSVISLYPSMKLGLPSSTHFYLSGQDLVYANGKYQLKKIEQKRIK